MLQKAPSHRKISRLNRRQRKKLRVGEFQERLLEIRVMLRPGLEAQAQDAFLSELMTLIESRHGARRNGGLYLLEGAESISAWWRGAPTADDRDALLAWLGQRPEAAGAEIGLPSDAWYDAA